MSIGNASCPKCEMGTVECARMLRLGYRRVSAITLWITSSQSPRTQRLHMNGQTIYASARFNGRKGVKSILDPFTLQSGWFVLNFKSFLIFPNAMLDDAPRKEVADTIGILKLNSDDDLVNERATYFNEYASGHVTFAHLEKRAPFIAFEVERQGLLDT
jgi:hypothetical protein